MRCRFTARFSNRSIFHYFRYFNHRISKLSFRRLIDHTLIKGLQPANNTVDKSSTEATTAHASVNPGPPIKQKAVFPTRPPVMVSCSGNESSIKSATRAALVIRMRWQRHWELSGRLKVLLCELRVETPVEVDKHLQQQKQASCRSLMLSPASHDYYSRTQNTSLHGAYRGPRAGTEHMQTCKCAKGYPNIYHFLQVPTTKHLHQVHI